nr:TPA_asm: coat protein [Holcus ophiovirus]
MSGTKTVSQVMEVARKLEYTEDDKQLLISLQILREDERVNTKVMNKMKEMEKESPNAMVYVKSDKTLEFITSTTVSSSTMQKVGSGTTVVASEKGKEVEFSPEVVNEMIQIKSLSMDAGKIKSILENYIVNLPKTAETYKTGDILVFWFKGVALSISSLLSAGTRILDAVMYMAYKDSSEHNFIFATTELKPGTVNATDISKKIENGNKAIKAAFCLIYTQGELPSKSTEEKQLPKFVRETLFKGYQGFSSNVLVDMLSSADPSLFPAEVFLGIELTQLPNEVASRCKMSVAGNKAIRYAMLAQRFEKNNVTAPRSGDQAEILRFSAEVEKLNKAKSITDLLSSLGSNFEAQKRMHPKSASRPTRKNFTLQMTCAIIYSLSPKGRDDLRKTIDEGKIESFKRDPNFYGSINQIHEVTHNVLMNKEADFSELSVDAIRIAYGLST